MTAPCSGVLVLHDDSTMLSSQCVVSAEEVLQCKQLHLIGIGKFLAGSFLSEENKIMVELKAAAEKRSGKKRSADVTSQAQEQNHGQAPFGWLFSHMRRDW